MAAIAIPLIPALIPAIPTVIDTARNIMFTMIKMVFVVLIIIGLIVFFSGKYSGGLITIIFGSVVLYVLNHYFPYTYRTGGTPTALSSSASHSFTSRGFDIFGYITDGFNYVKGMITHFTGGADDTDPLIIDDVDIVGKPVESYQNFIRLCQLPDISSDDVNTYVNFILENGKNILSKYTQLTEGGKHNFMKMFNKLDNIRLADLREELISS
jgi:hypothetical protein